MKALNVNCLSILWNGFAMLQSRTPERGHLQGHLKFKESELRLICCY